MANFKKILRYIGNNILYKSNDVGSVERTQMNKLGDIRSVLDFGAKNDGTDPIGTRKAIQFGLDILKENRGGGLYFPEGIYLIDRPLLLEKNRDPGFPDNIVEEYNNWLHIWGQGAIIRRAESFTGDRLLTILADSGDKEDSIIIEGLTFNGLSHDAEGHPKRDIVGVDFFESHVPHNTKHPTYPPNYGYPDNPNDPDYVPPSAYTKHVNFTKCIFTFCYIGVRLNGNSHSFVQCQFRGNHCGAFITPATNDIRFTDCSFRIGGVGADIVAGSQTGQENWGTTGIGFFGCIFEGNNGSGIRSKGSNVSIHGGYFEKNGYSYSACQYDLSDQDSSMRNGGAIHKETGKATGSIHIHGAYFSYQKMYANSLKNCFIECTGDLTIIPKKYGDYPEGPWAHCPLDPTFMHGSIRLQVDDTDDVKSGDRFTLNNEIKIIAATTAKKYKDAPHSEICLAQPHSITYQVIKQVTIPYPTEPDEGVNKEPLSLLHFDFCEYISNGYLELTVPITGYNIGGNFSHAAIIKKGFFIFKSKNDNLFTIVPNGDSVCANTNAPLASSNASTMGSMLDENADLQLIVSHSRVTVLLSQWINTSVATLGIAVTGRFSIHFSLSGQVVSTYENLDELLIFD